MKLQKIKKAAFAAVVSVMMAGTLAGCGQKSGETQAPASQGAQTQGEQSQAASGSREAVTLTMWGMSDDEDCYRAVIEAYQSEHPNVNIELILYSSSEIDNALTTALAGKDDMDIFVTNGGQFLAGKIGLGMTEKLDDYVANAGFDTSVFGDDFENAKYDDGSIYGLPYRNSVGVVVYNKDYFDERGVAYPDENTTWDELTEIAEQMTWGDGPDKVYGFYNAARNSDWIAPASTNGVDYLSDDLSLIQKAVELKIDACEKGVMLSNAAYTAAGIGVRPMFASGKSSMYLGGDWTIRQLRGDRDKGEFMANWDVAPMPTLGDGYAKNTCVGQFVYASVCSYSGKKQEAYDFLQYLCGEPGGMIFAEMGTLPAIRTEEAKTAFCGDGSQMPQNIELFFNTNTVQGMPVKAGMSELDIFVKAEADLVFNGEETPEDMINKLYEEQKKYR
ncbi:MAG: extracellular solute-binding protein [Hungatella hathewayi]|nr:extracellular solute-binding protein [Hungatella hathewayi]